MKKLGITVALSEGIWAVIDSTTQVEIGTYGTKDEFCQLLTKRGADNHQVLSIVSQVEENPTGVRV